MIFQLDFFSMAIIISIINIFIGLIIGTTITKWSASKKGWEDSFTIAFFVNLPWIILSLILNILETFYISIVYMNFPFIAVSLFIIAIVNILIVFVINTILSTLLVQRFYRKEIKESVSFVFYILIILYILMVIFTFIRSYFLGLLAIL